MRKIILHFCIVLLLGSFVTRVSGEEAAISPDTNASTVQKTELISNQETKVEQKTTVKVEDKAQALDQAPVVEKTVQTQPEVSTDQAKETNVKDTSKENKMQVKRKKEDTKKSKKKMKKRSRKKKGNKDKKKKVKKKKDKKKKGKKKAKSKNKVKKGKVRTKLEVEISKIEENKNIFHEKTNSSLKLVLNNEYLFQGSSLSKEAPKMLDQVERISNLYSLHGAVKIYVYKEYIKKSLANLWVKKIRAYFIKKGIAGTRISTSANNNPKKEGFIYITIQRSPNYVVPVSDKSDMGDILDFWKKKQGITYKEKKGHIFTLTIDYKRMFDEKTYKAKKDSIVVLNDIVKFRNLYNKNSTISIHIDKKEIPVIGKSLDIAKSKSEEIKRYLVKRKINEKRMDVITKEGKIKGDIIEIVLLKEMSLTMRKEKINLILNDLNTIEGMDIKKDENNDNFIDFNIKPELFFEGADTEDLKVTASKIIESIIDVFKLFSKDGSIIVYGFQDSYYKSDKKRILLDRTKVIADYFKNSKISKKQILLKYSPDRVLKIKLSKKLISNVNKIPYEQIKFDPVVVYYDNNSPKNSFVPTGWMGAVSDLKFNVSSKQNAYSGLHAIEVKYSAKDNLGWTGIYWQRPANNWGDKPGGLNLTGAKKLTFWARGKYGGEKITEVKIGGIRGMYSDSATVSNKGIILTKNWKKYSVDLKGRDLSFIIGGFAFILSKSDNKYGCTVYLDEIKFE